MTFTGFKRTLTFIILIGLGGWILLAIKSHLSPSPVMNIVRQSAHPTLAPTKSLQSFTQQNRSQSPPPMDLLKEILASHNDNDPRLDRAFNHLSFEEKKEFEIEYRHLKPELRNEKGTILYLLGKNLNSAEDFVFLTQVLQEAPCHSLKNCAQAADLTPSASHAQEASSMAVTLAYPQMVTLTILAEYRKNHPESPYQNQIKTLFDRSKNSSIQPIRELATVLASKR